jgi:CDP-diacylglycerol--glycerol-3-phosphate 3-phosphatidyltransferase
LPLALVPGVPAALVVVSVILGIVSEMAGVVAIQVGADRRYDGPLGKSDRAFVFGCIAFLIGCGLEPGKWLVYVLSIMIALACLTIMKRSYRALTFAARPTPTDTILSP